MLWQRQSRPHSRARVALILRCGLARVNGIPKLFSMVSPLWLAGTLVSPSTRLLLESPLISQPSNSYPQPGHKCSLVFRQGLKETPCRFLETLLCEVPSSPVPCPKTAAGSGGEMLICFLHPDCCSWTPSSFAVWKAFQGENCSACEVHLLVSLPARIIVLYVCVQHQKIVVSHTFPTFISSLW